MFTLVAIVAMDFLSMLVAGWKKKRKIKYEERAIIFDGEISETYT